MIDKMEYESSLMTRTKSEERFKAPSKHQDLILQNELLKEKIKNFEEETNNLLRRQKEEFDQLMIKKDEEISVLVEQLALENTELKKQIVMKDIDLECLREANEELQSRFNELEKSKVTDRFTISNKMIEKDLVSNIKIIEENHMKRTKEIEEKYDMIFKSLNREYRGNLSNFRKISMENKTKYSNSKLVVEREEILFLPQIEEFMVTFVNKFQLIYEELRSKERFINEFEQKYELLNEENKFLKRKIAEDKTLSLKHSEEINFTKKEREKHNDEIKQSSSNPKLGTTLQKHIEKTFENNEKIAKEKEEYKEKFYTVSKQLAEYKDQLSVVLGEKEELEELLNVKDKDIKTLSVSMEQMIKEMKALNGEKNHLARSNEESSSRYKDLNAKVINLEVKLKSSYDQINALKNELRNLNEEKENQSDTLKREILELKREVLDVTNRLQDEKLFSEKSVRSKEEEIRKCLEDIRSLEDRKKNELLEKDRLLNEMDYQIINLNSKIKSLNTLLEDEKRVRESLSEELERIRKETFPKPKQNDPNDLISSLKKSQSKFNNEFIQKLYSSNNFEKNIKVINESATPSVNNPQKMTILENTNAELRKELLSQRQTISRIYDVIKQSSEKLKIKSNFKDSNEEVKMLLEIESYLNDMISKLIQYESQLSTFDEKIYKQNYEKQTKLINDLAHEKIKYDEEIRNLKKKLIYNNINLTNPMFKSLDSNKVTQNILYESIIIFVKNLNIKFIFDLFESKLENEQEKLTLLNESKKASSNEVSNSKKLETLMKEFKDYRKFCESVLIDYDKRSSQYRSFEEFSDYYIEFKGYCESMFDFVFTSLMQFKRQEDDENILFNVPINTFNDIIEKVSSGFQEYEAKVAAIGEDNRKVSEGVGKAIEVLISHTKVDPVVIDKILNNPLSNKLV